MNSAIQCDTDTIRWEKINMRLKTDATSLVYYMKMKQQIYRRKERKRKADDGDEFINPTQSSNSWRLSEGRRQLNNVEL